MNPDKNFQIYNSNLTYIEGWYSIQDIENILRTMKRIKDVDDHIAANNKQLSENNTTE